MAGTDTGELQEKESVRECEKVINEVEEQRKLLQLVFTNIDLYNNYTAKEKREKRAGDTSKGEGSTGNSMG